MANCIYCGTELPSHAKFCYKCQNQIVCLNCNTTLLKNSSICISCGESIKNRNVSNSAVNNIEFTENENGKTFKASFTDTVAGNVVETFAQLLPFRNYNHSKAIPQSYDNSVQEMIEDGDIEEVSKPSVTPPIQTPAVNKDLATLEKIFKNKNGIITIYDTRVKAKSKGDFVARIALLFLYYKKEQGLDEVERDDLNNLLKTENLYDANFRKWLSKNRKLINNASNSLELRPEGLEKAVNILSEFRDDTILNTWELNKNSKKNGQPKEEIQDIKKSNSSLSKKTASYQIVQTLNLKPTGKIFLVDFFKKYPTTNNLERNLVFVYYLEKILEEKSIGINHIYTCYKEVGQKVPNNLYQSIVDTKKRKGWIESSDMDNITISIVGENYLEHDMKK